MLAWRRIPFLRLRLRYVSVIVVVLGIVDYKRWRARCAYKRRAELVRVVVLVLRTEASTQPRVSSKVVILPVRRDRVVLLLHLETLLAEEDEVDPITEMDGTVTKNGRMEDAITRWHLVPAVPAHRTRPVAVAVEILVTLDLLLDPLLHIVGRHVTRSGS